MSDALSPYPAILISSYGGPRGPEDVLPFMRNATAGRPVPDERLIEVSRHYQLFGGRSPINEQNEALRRALAAELARRGCPREVVVGNRNWTPFLADTVAGLRDQGHRRVAVLTTSAYSSYSSCRQYHEDLEQAMRQVPEVRLDKLGPYWHQDGFLTANTDALVAAVTSLRDQVGQQPIRVLFVTHSIPTAMNDLSGGGRPENRYQAQHLQVAAEVVRRAQLRLGEQLDWELCYCSRSGPPQVPWLEPDINDRIADLNAVVGLVAAPIGFISDHMEVAYDLDTQARDSAAAAGLAFVRAATVGTHPAFVSALADLLEEQAAVARGEIRGPQHPCFDPSSGCCRATAAGRPHEHQPSPTQKENDVSPPDAR